MNSKALDPNLASILDSIRATVSTDEPASSRQTQPEEKLASASPVAAEATSNLVGQLKATAKAQAAPVPASGSRTVEDFLADLIRPQVEAWLNANLPEIIQKMAADEIARLINDK